MTKPDITIIRGIKKGEWIWCLHCERCYQAGEYREINTLQMCPYANCGGDTVMDARIWLGIRGIHPEYPEIPEREKVYQLYT